MDGWIPLVAFVAIIAAGWMVSFTGAAGERVGEIYGEPGPLTEGRSISIDVRRSVEGGLFPTLTVMVRSAPSLFTPKFAAKQASELADALVAAAQEAVRPESPEPRGLSLHQVAGETITLGVVRKDGLGYVLFRYSDGEFGTASCLSPGDCESLGAEMKVACQPGKDLEAAARRWTRLQESQRAAATRSPPDHPPESGRA